MSRAIAALGDSALLLPASGFVCLYLLMLRQGRLAAAFAGALALTGAATVALKLAFHACGHVLPGPNVMSPSGHVSFATLFYGGLAAALAPGRTRRVRLALAGAAALLVLAIAASRVRTSAHTVPEVLIGLAVGAAGLALLVRQHARLGRPHLPAWPLAAGFAAALVLVGGSHFSLEGAIGRAARRITATLDICADPGPHEAWRWRTGELGTGWPLLR